MGDFGEICLGSNSVAPQSIRRPVWFLVLHSCLPKMLASLDCSELVLAASQELMYAPMILYISEPFFDFHFWDEIPSKLKTKTNLSQSLLLNKLESVFRFC